MTFVLTFKDMLWFWFDHFDSFSKTAVANLNEKIYFNRDQHHGLFIKYNIKI